MSSYPSEYTPTGDGAGKFSPADILFKYLAYLPLFIVTLVLSVLVGVIYLRYTKLKYVSTTQILLKSSNETQAISARQSDLVSIAMYGSSDINLNNEMEKLKSVKVMTRMVVKHQFNINYFNEGNIKTSNIFTTVPFRLIPVEIKDSSQAYKIKFTDITASGYDLIMGTGQLEKHLWTDVLNVKGSLFKLQPIRLIKKEEGIYITTWVDPVKRANEILSELTIAPKDANSAILNISIKNDNSMLGKAILNGMAEEFNLASIEAKNLAAENTIKFIDNRLDSLSRELAILDRPVIRGNDVKDMLSVEQQSSLFFTRMIQTDQTLNDLDLQLSLAKMVGDYVQNPSTKNKIVPSTLGISDITVSDMVNAYNQMQIQREKEAPNLPAGGMMMQQLDGQMEELRKSILESLSNYSRAVQNQKADVMGKNELYKSYLGQIPEKQRLELEIERQKKVKENLYLYLLQKREETAIATASTSASYEQLNAATGKAKPVEPDESKIRLFSIMVGLLLPIGIIYVRDQLNDRLYTRDDIQKKTKVPIIGEIGHVDDNRSLVVAHQSRSIVSEQFRIVRSNLGFFQKEKDFKTILVTSTVSGEGKSFVSINMAAVLALSGKKIALLEFDLRKPRILTNLSIEKTGLGISNFLLGMAKADEIYTPMDNFPNLHIYPSGIVPPNPAELMLSENNRIFFDYLKSNYDYIIIDSAPVGLVSDTFTLAAFVDVSLYLVRHRFTYKRQISFIDEIQHQEKLPNLYIVVNDLKMGARFGYYGYGYGYGKGYGYGYGYYYGYGGGYHDSGAGEYYDIKLTGWRKWRASLRRAFGLKRKK
jgi:capsular exopolysaccharide synthesis family protein